MFLLSFFYNLKKKEGKIDKKMLLFKHVLHQKFEVYLKKEGWWPKIISFFFKYRQCQVLYFRTPHEYCSYFLYKMITFFLIDR